MKAISLNNIRMRPKLIGAFLIVGLAPLFTYMFFGLNRAEEALEREAFAKLEAVQTLMAGQVGDYYNDRINDAIAYASNPVIQQAYLALDYALDTGGAKGETFRGDGGSEYQAPAEYQRTHDMYFKTFKSYIDQYGYGDLLLMCPEHGHISFSVAKDGDFGQAIGEIPSPLRDVWEIVVGEDRVALSDIKPYSPTGDTPAQYIAAPIKVGRRTMGVMALKVSTDAVNAIMQARAGMGESGETYLVGDDRLMRSDSQLDMENRSLAASLAGTVEQNGVDTEMVSLALAGEFGARVQITRSGREVLSVYSPVEIGPDVTWACLAEVDMAEVGIPVRRLRRDAMIMGSVFALIIAIQAYWFAFSMASPLRKISQVADRMAQGDFNATANIEQRDEIGDLAQAFRRMGEAVKAKASCAQQIGEGYLDVEIPVSSEADILGKAMVAMRSSINNVASETDALVHAAIQGRLGERAGADNFHGHYREIIEGINSTLDALVSHLDAVPAPITIVDVDFRVLYLNTAAIELVAADSDDVLIGAPYHDLLQRGDSRDETCAVKRAISTGVTTTVETDAHPQGRAMEISYTGVPVRDQKGEIIGALEVVTDLTEIKRAARKAEKIKNFQDGEVEKLTEALENVAAGDLHALAEVGEADSDTLETREVFVGIADAVTRTIAAIQALVDDTNALARSAQEGNLTTRADAGKHGGDFREVVQGINRTLDAVIDPITEAGRVLERMAGKDLTNRVQGDYFGDHAKVKNALNSALDTLDGSLKQVEAGTTQVTLAANQISSGSHDLAHGASRQANSIQEVSGSLKDMADMAQKDSECAGAAKDLAHSASEASNTGMDSMGRLSAAIERIQSSSSETARIIKTIDEIAFQTNLLALNASVEAARAGDAGKGFAVVAEEVRNLAMRSTEAAKNTSELIEESVANANAGVSIQGEVLTHLNQINDKVQDVTGMMSDIASSSDRQRGQLEQINTAVSQLNQVTQDNAANAEESASSSEELRTQSEEMRRMVQEFCLSDGQTSEVPDMSMDSRVEGSQSSDEMALDEAEQNLLSSF